MIIESIDNEVGVHGRVSNPPSRGVRQLATVIVSRPLELHEVVLWLFTSWATRYVGSHPVAGDLANFDQHEWVSIDGL